MDAEKFTKKSLEVIESCEKLAYEYNLSLIHISEPTRPY